jgi:septal ring-binding cell division protein DamX
VQVQDEPFLQEQTAQTDTGQVQTAQEKNQPDTTVALLETPSIDEKKNAPEDEQGEEAEEVDMSSTETKLSDMKGDYTVQVIAYSEKSKAVETAENLENAGYPAFVEKIPMKGGEWYTVRIGRYKTPAEAEKAVKNFADELKEHYVIDKIRKK